MRPWGVAWSLNTNLQHREQDIKRTGSRLRAHGNVTRASLSCHEGFLNRGSGQPFTGFT